jgi:hypothetical protein
MLQVGTTGINQTTTNQFHHNWLNESRPVKLIATSWVVISIWSVAKIVSSLLHRAHKHQRNCWRLKQQPRPETLITTQIWISKRGKDFVKCKGINLTISKELSPSWKAKRCSATQEFPVFYLIRKFFTAFIKGRHLFLYRTRWIQPTSNPIYLRIIVIVYLHIRLCLPSSLIRFSYQNPACTLLPCVLHGLSITPSLKWSI